MRGVRIDVERWINMMVFYRTDSKIDMYYVIFCPVLTYVSVRNVSKH